MIGRICANALLALCLIPTSASLGDVINGGFETGNLSGWTSSGNVAVLSVSPYLPDGGTYYASILANSVNPASTLYQDFAIGSPHQLSFQYYFDLTGPATVRYGLMDLGNSSTHYFENSSYVSGGVETPFDAPDFIPTVDYLISAAGNYRLFVEATSSGSGSVSAELENVTLTAVPEPSSCLLCGAVAAGAWIRRRRWQSAVSNLSVSPSDDSTKATV